MSHSQTYRVPCNRCGNPVGVSVNDYNQSGGEVYCEECLVPFICDECGMRKYTIPENVPRDSSLICGDCVTNTRKNGGKGPRFSWLNMTIFGLIGAGAIYLILLVLNLIGTEGEFSRAFLELIQSTGGRVLIFGIGITLLAFYKFRDH